MLVWLLVSLRWKSGRLDHNHVIVVLSFIAVGVSGLQWLLVGRRGGLLLGLRHGAAPAGLIILFPLSTCALAYAAPSFFLMVAILILDIGKLIVCQSLMVSHDLM